MTQEALKQLANEMLDTLPFNTPEYWMGRIKEALAQRTEQEPVKMVAYNCTCGRTMKFESVHGVVAPQRTWHGLTDEDISEIVRGTHNTGSFVRAIEAKLKEKNCV